MAKRFYSGTSVATTITAALDATATTVTVATLTGYPTQFPYTAILDRGTGSEEVITVTAAAGTTLTVQRGVEAAAKTHASGASFAHGVSAIDFTNVVTTAASGGGGSDALGLMGFYK